VERSGPNRAASSLGSATGEILPLANQPHLRSETTTRRPQRRQANRAATDYFEPGSISGDLAAAALEEGVIRRRTSSRRERLHRSGRRHDPRSREKYGLDHGPADLGVLQATSGRSEIGQKLGEEPLLQLYQWVRVWSLTGLICPERRQGLIRRPKGVALRSRCCP